MSLMTRALQQRSRYGISAIGKHRGLLLATAFVLTFTCAPETINAQSRATNVYVADFKSDDMLDRKLLGSITDDFEFLMSESGTYNMLERRNIGDLKDALQNEANLRNNPDLVKQLRNKGADAVLFGRVHDDVESGSYAFYVSLVKLDSTIFWKRTASLTRGLIRDRDSRLDALRKLIPEEGKDTKKAPSGMAAGDQQASQITGANRNQTGNSSLVPDADPNARLSYMEQVVTSGDARKIQSALQTAFKSNDQPLRSIGVRAYIASQKELTLNLQLQPDIQRQFDEAQADPEAATKLINKYPYIDFLEKHGFRLHLAFGKYDMSTSRGIISESSLGSSSNGTFAIAGDRLTGTVRATVLRLGKAPTVFASEVNYTTVECGFDVRPVGAPMDDPTWKGTLSCQNWGNVAIPRIALSSPIF